MAVSLNMNNYHADQFTGSVNMSQRVEVQQNTQGSGFAQILGSRNTADSGVSVNSNSSNPANIGSVNSSGTVNTDASGKDLNAALAPVDAVISDKLNEAVGSEILYQDTVQSDEAGVIEDAMQLARDIIDGNVKLEDIPEDEITFDLLKALLIVKFRKKIEEDEKASDPKTESVDQTCTSAQVDAMLAILYAVIDSYVESRNSDSNEGTGFMQQVEKISEMLEEFEEEIDMTSLLARLIIEKTDEEEQEAAEGVDELGEGEVTVEEEIEPVGAKFIDKLAELIGDDKAKLLQEAIEKGDITEVTKAVKQIVGEIAKPEVPEETGRFTVTSKISEELEMLRNAKSSQKQPEDILKEFGVKLESTVEKVEAAVNVQTSDDSNSGKQEANSGANTNAAAAVHEAPVVFRTDDGVEFEIQPGEVVSQAMKLVEQAIRDTAEQTEYSLVLNPGELGRITVKMIKAADGAVSVTIAAENSHTQRILEENSSLMQSNLRNSGIQLESWQTVSESRQETLAQDYNGSSKNPYYRGEQNTEEQEPEETFAEIIAAM